MKAVRLITEEERARREDAVRFARNSVRLEGFILKDGCYLVIAA